MLGMIAKLLKILNAESNPTQISVGFAVGLIMGLTPLWSLHNLVLLFLVFLLRVNLSAFFLSTAFFSGIAYIADPAMDRLGNSMLTSPALHAIWTSMYNQTFWRLTHFNNTLTLGSFISAVVIAVPMIFVSNFFIIKYRMHILAWVRKTRIAQFLKAGKLYRAYRSLSGGN